MAESVRAEVSVTTTIVALVLALFYSQTVCGHRRWWRLSESDCLVPAQWFR